MKRFISVLAASSALASPPVVVRLTLLPRRRPRRRQRSLRKTLHRRRPAPPPMPAPNAPKSDVSPEPKPGQANDHSSPAFKAGGKEATKEAPK